MGLKAKLNNTLEWGKINSPKILLVSGLIEGAVGTVLACRATLKAKDILDKEANTNKEKTKKVKDVFVTFAPSVITLLCSGTSICTGFNILDKRFVGAVATCGSYAAALFEYRERVREEVGEEKEEALYYGTEKQVISLDAIQKDGKHKKVNKKLDIRARNGLSPYAQKWDPIKALGTDNAFYVDQHIERVTRDMTDKLIAEGHLYLNRVREEFFLDQDDIGQLAGWISDPHGFKDGKGDGFVKAIKKDIYVKQGDEYVHEIWLDFNVDGVIFGKMSSKEYNEGINEIGDRGLTFSNKED